MRSLRATKPRMGAQLHATGLSVVLIAATLVLQSASEAEQTADSAAKLIAPPSPDELIAATIAGVRARDLLLQNFSFTLTSSTSNVDPRSGKKSFLHKEEYTFKRARDHHLCRVEVYGSHKELVGETTTNWDGAQAISLTKNSGISVLSGRIEDSESGNFRNCAYNQMLGFRMLEAGPPQSVISSG